MAYRRGHWSLMLWIALSACGAPAPVPETTARTCMGDHARAIGKRYNRRPNFDEAARFIKQCNAEYPTHSDWGASEIATYACAYSQQWGKCGRPPPTD